MSDGSLEFEHHVATYGPQRDFGYKDFIPRLNFDRYDPRDMAALFRRAGAQFVVPVAEHHDGFAMYDEPRTRWKAPLMGPRQNDTSVSRTSWGWIEGHVYKARNATPHSSA